MTEAHRPIEQGQKASAERSHEQLVVELLRSGGLPDAELGANVHAFLNRPSLARVMFLAELYDRILRIPGVIVQCGVRWGGDLAVLQHLRTMLEPFHYARRIVGFDTFEGLRGTGSLDAGDTKVTDGQYGVAPGWKERLAELLASSERSAPLAHLPKHELVVGDVRETVPAWLGAHRGETIALLYLDMDVYEPTRAALDACEERLVPGSVVVFDELASRQFPGEAVAMRAFMARRRVELVRSRWSTVAAYGIVG